MYMGMPDLNAPKRIAEPSAPDWHPADVICALTKAGWSLRSLSAYHGYARKSLQVALRKPWPRAERLIAEALGLHPQGIWPSRYRADGSPKSRRGERGIGRYKKQHSTAEDTARQESATPIGHALLRSSNR